MPPGVPAFTFSCPGQEIPFSLNHCSCRAPGFRTSRSCACPPDPSVLITIGAPPPRLCEEASSWVLSATSPAQRPVGSRLRSGLTSAGAPSHFGYKLPARTNLFRSKRPGIQRPAPYDLDRAVLAATANSIRASRSQMKSLTATASRRMAVRSPPAAPLAHPEEFHTRPLVHPLRAVCRAGRPR